MIPATFDELNRLVGYKRSMPVDKFFDEMRISKSQKQLRKDLAERLNDEFDYVMAYMFYLQVNGIPIASTDIVSEITGRYRDAVGFLIPIDLYVANRIAKTAYEVTDATIRHPDDPYFYSLDRSRLIAENESNTLYSYDEFNEEALNARYKRWLTIMDGKERDSHAEVNETVLPIDEPFELQGGYADFPRDLSYGISDDEVINCRCSLKFLK